MLLILVKLFLLMKYLIRKEILVRINIKFLLLVKRLKFFFEMIKIKSV